MKYCDSDEAFISGHTKLVFNQSFVNHKILKKRPPKLVLYPLCKMIPIEFVIKGSDIVD